VKLANKILKTSDKLDGDKLVLLYISFIYCFISTNNYHYNLYSYLSYVIYLYSFFTVQDGVRMATPLLLCTICIELSDVVFAFDSVPAIFGVTEDPLIVFSSNM